MEKIFIRFGNYELFEKPKIKKPTKQGRFYYFYSVKSYDNRGHEIMGPSIGKMLVPNYEKNKKLIENLRKEGNIEELQKYLNQY
ncbi:hypothetical protein LCGC14_1471610 [marine sediment metagenome]|uniref:Uncharacterized protein n=1 Tax=marine sediment metagenome TaxID=412755 RepID=A0A0F9JY72_9ZZZZ